MTDRRRVGKGPFRWVFILPSALILILTNCGSGGGGDAPAVPPGAPTVSISANPQTVNQGGSATLAWSSTNATSCVASGSWSGNKAISGSELLANLASSGTYTLTCTGPNGSGDNSVNVVVLSPLPAGTGLTSATIANLGTTGNVVATFGQAFRQGDVAAGNTVGGKLADNTAVPLQVDGKTTHSDGSLRFAVLTANLGSISSGESKTVILYSKAAGSAETPVALSDLLATSFDATISLTVDGTVYTASAADFLKNNNPVAWLSGPEVSEWTVGGPVKNGTTPHPHLNAYFHVRAYKGNPIVNVRVDAVVENGWTFVSGSTSYSYSATVAVGGNTIYSNSALTQYHHTRWHVVGWWGTTPNTYIKPDTQYLRNTLAVPNYDNAITVQESVLNGYTQAITPMGKANLRTNWGDTGYHPQIGLLPEWDASFLISGDQRAYNAVLANASAGGSYSYHYRDETTGGLPSIDSYPTLSEQGPSGGLVLGTGGNSVSHDTAHSPDIGYLAYCLTGDYYYLEELQFLSNWCLLNNNATYRGYDNGVFTGQNRSQAWSIRSISHAAAATPDGYTVGGTDYKDYFIDKLNHNITDRQTKWSSGPTNVLGGIQDYDWPNNYSPWQNDFFVAVFNRIVELGFQQGTEMRDWLNRWPAGRLGKSDTEFCYVYATKYNFAPAGIVDGNGDYYAGFRELYVAIYPTESASPCPAGSLMHSNAYPETATGYYSNMQPAVAMARDAGAVTADQWSLFESAGTPDYSGAPVWAIVPR